MFLNWDIYKEHVCVEIETNSGLNIKWQAHWK